MGQLWVIKPVSYTSKNLLGGVITVDTADLGNSAADSASDVLSDIRGDVGTRAHLGFPNSPTDTDWSESGDVLNKDILVLKISAIGSNYSPTLSQLNQHKLITEYWHSNNANSVNGNDYRDTVGNYDFDETNLTVSISGEDTISFTNYATGVATTQAHTTALRSWDPTTTHYYNGILVSSNSFNEGSSGNEEYDTTYTQTSVQNAFDKLEQSEENNNAWHSVELAKILGSDTNSAVNFCDTDISGTWNKQNDTYFSLKAFIENFPENEITKKQLFQLMVALVGANQPINETLKYAVESMVDNNEL